MRNSKFGDKIFDNPNMALIVDYPGSGMAAAAPEYTKPLSNDTTNEKHIIDLLGAQYSTMEASE